MEASHSRKALGDHGTAERRLRARCPPVSGGRAERRPSAGGNSCSGDRPCPRPPTCGSPTPAPTSAPPPRFAPRPARLAPPGGAVLARPSGREPSAQPGGLRGGGGLGAGEVWATVGSAAVRSQVEAGGPGGGRTGLRTPPGPLPLCRVLSPGKGLLSGMGASPTAPAGACT